MQLDAAAVKEAVRRALTEDLEDRGDLTANAVISEDCRGSAYIVAKEPGVLAGIDCAIHACLTLDPECEIVEAAKDGVAFVAGDVVFRVVGRARALLAAERTALNFLQRLSGIATRTRSFVDEVRGTGAVVLETRKTTPGLRYFEKYAVRVGGGQNHRYGLFDRILLKENHFALSGNGTDAAGYKKTVEQAVAYGGKYGPVTVEVRDLPEAEAAFHGGADILLLDNMDLAGLRAAVGRIRDLKRTDGRDVLLEASGGITLDTAATIAATGVDRLSIGGLTHSVPAIDLSMLVAGGEASA
ncbi:MAG: carboxylating nicotinate-nucleotide diphosphorylase [Planctomycetes bacterium]|nr:carboxylating nicotinate-nucleotide diphosphorylase [Planctomycetota bacterium]